MRIQATFSRQQSFNLSVCCVKSMEEKGSDHKRAFGQFSSDKTQRPITSEPVKLELNSVSFAHFWIDFNKGDIVIKQRRVYLLIACPQMARLVVLQIVGYPIGKVA